MNTVHFDAPCDDAERRQRLYEGDLFVYSPCPAALDLCRLAQDLVEDAFPGVDPREAQHGMPVPDFAAILGKLKPKFIHHPKAKECLRALLLAFGCELEQT